MGSISFARIIMRFVAPDMEMTGIELMSAKGKEKIHISSFSGTAVSMKLGGKWGGFTGILDILKVLLPALVFRFAFRGAPYYLIVASMGMVGHNWPVYYRFKGGRGLSPMTGGFLAVAPVGTIVTSMASLFLGFKLKRVLLSYMLGPWLMIPWIWLRFGDIAHVGYALLVNVLFGVAMIPDIRGMIDRRRRGVSGNYAQAMEMTPQGRSMKKLGIRLGMIKEN
jgi:glycerol-3-phosphate acyltransferase PlsY